MYPSSVARTACTALTEFKSPSDPTRTPTAGETTRPRPNVRALGIAGAETVSDPLVPGIMPVITSGSSRL
jgi:hypothetical protein